MLPEYFVARIKHALDNSFIHFVQFFIQQSAKYFVNTMLLFYYQLLNGVQKYFTAHFLDNRICKNYLLENIYYFWTDLCHLLVNSWKVLLIIISLVSTFLNLLSHCQLPYRTKIRRTKLPKCRLGVENFVRQKICPSKILFNISI